MFFNLSEEGANCLSDIFLFVFYYYLLLTPYIPHSSLQHLDYSTVVLTTLLLHLLYSSLDLRADIVVKQTTLDNNVYSCHTILSTVSSKQKIYTSVAIQYI